MRLYIYACWSYVHILFRFSGHDYVNDIELMMMMMLMMLMYKNAVYDGLVRLIIIHTPHIQEEHNRKRRITRKGRCVRNRYTNRDATK